MKLITLIVLLSALYVVYLLYKSYNNIVKELKEIKNKCIKEGVSDKEAFKSSITDENPIDKEINGLPKKMSKSLISLLKKIN
jgi:archaellum component FlaF (FlaF/FlaG flagellin family)